MKYQKTEWGIRVKTFMLKYGITQRKLADACGVSYPTLLAVIVGRTPGLHIVPKVDAYIAEFTAKYEPKNDGLCKPIENL